MRMVLAADLDRILSFPKLVDAIDQALRMAITVPPRHHHTIETPGSAPATCLIMPAWSGGAERYLGIKLVNIFPDNGARNLPSVMGSYVLMSGETGAPLAMMDGTRLTLWRTAAVSALASRYVSRADSRRLVMVGAGALAPFLIKAHRSVRPIEHVTLWNRSRARSVSVVQALKADGIQVQIADDLETAVRRADIVSCATLSSTPLVHGAWLKPGAHLDLVGAFTPDMRESDDEAVRLARILVDTREGSLKEGGDLVQPIKAGVIPLNKVEAELSDLAHRRVVFERKADDVTLFKSTGSAVFDLAAAMTVHETLLAKAA
jgi:alanine dehydrogenase